MSEELNIAVRPADSGDRHFILATWIQGAFYDIKEYLRPDLSRYSATMGLRIEKLIDDPGTTIRVASDTDDPHWIVGYAVCSGPELHWIYVRKDFRKQGLARFILKDLQITHVRNLTRIGQELAERQGLIFKPQL